MLTVFWNFVDLRELFSIRLRWTNKSNVIIFLTKKNNVLVKQLFHKWWMSLWCVYVCTTSSTQLFFESLKNVYLALLIYYKLFQDGRSFSKMRTFVILLLPRFTKVRRSQIRIPYAAITRWTNTAEGCPKYWSSAKCKHGTITRRYVFCNYKKCKKKGLQICSWYDQQSWLWSIFFPH